MTIYEKYCVLKEKTGVRDADVANATGIGKSTFSDWKSGRSEPKREKLQKIADYFGVPTSYFDISVQRAEDDSCSITIENINPVQALTAQEKHILELYRHASQEARQYASLILESRQPNA